MQDFYGLMSENEKIKNIIDLQNLIVNVLLFVGKQKFYCLQETKALYWENKLLQR